MEGFAMRLTQLRKKKGYTQAQLAEKIGVSNKSVSRGERGISKS
ncbi:XRE family transcriptional regulator [Absiella sp. AM54-8XD]|nr:helix-turn-helix transcriptional regulator [Absiella sp. AM09-45]RGB55240.1 XRE family transcriptional regulator [Absiella sp. AM22-9]RGB62967.1 XRE family transcriptional regulator [Absiella sp. AM10-20]RGB77866.1 XRE family transcriptional regulator [Absiella sp. AM09-50]RGC25352.1 XRE family transcriptional regulator [Absiella sp. AM54-8XD]RHU10121.1 XRE family transcriptional regulator [Absiella sp. AM27-20]